MPTVSATASRAARSTGCAPRRSPRSSNCSSAGGRSTARIASSHTAAATSARCGSRRPASDAFWLHPQADHRARLDRGDLDPGAGRVLDALEAEGLLELVEARQDQAPADTFPLDADVDATERHARNTQVQRSVVRFPIGAVLKKTALLQAEQYFRTIVACADSSFIHKEPSVRSEPIRAWCDRVRGLEPGRVMTKR